MLDQIVFRLFIIFLTVAAPTTALALFVDQFTNRNTPVADSLEILNSQMRSLISHSIEAANTSAYKCNERYSSNSDQSRDFLFAAFRRGLLDFPIDDFAESNKHVAKKQTLFKDSIFQGVYSSSILNILSGKILDTEAVINMDGRQVTTKKLARFLDDGFRLYKRQMTTHQPSVAQTEKQSFAEAEKFVNGTGVLSYAEHAASMAGYRFWVDLCGPSTAEGRCFPEKLVTCDMNTGKWELSKDFIFDFSDYVDDSWDEGINCSMYAADISFSITKNIQKVTGNKHLPCPVDPVKCFELSSTRSKKYLSPVCTNVAERIKKALPAGLFTDYTYKLNVPKAPADSTGKK